MIARLRALALFAAYPAFYLVCFVVFGYLAFPYDRLRERAVVEFEKGQHGGAAQRLEIGEIGPYRFTGLSLRDVKIHTGIARPGDKISAAMGGHGAAPSDVDLAPAVVALDEVHARVQILPLLLGRLSFAFGGKLAGGTFDGAVNGPVAERSYAIDLDSIELSELDMLTTFIGTPAFGKLGGKLAWTLAEEKFGKGHGEVDIAVAGLAIGDGKGQLLGHIALPRATFGDFAFTATGADGTLKATKLAAPGPDIELAGDGKIALHDPVGDSVADLSLRVKINDGFRGKNEMTKTIFGAPGSNAPALFELADQRIRAAKRPDGSYGFHVGGFIKDVRFDAAPNAGGPAPTPSKPGLR